MYWPRWKLKHLTIAIAALGLAFAVVGVEDTVVGLALCLPAILARPGRRLASQYWFAACYPWILLGSLYVTWFVAWWALGHPPRASMDDPKDIGPIAIPYHVTAILIFEIPLALVAAIGLTISRILLRSTPWRSGAYPGLLFGIVAMSWVVGLVLLGSDPLGVLNWYFD